MTPPVPAPADDAVHVLFCSDAAYIPHTATAAVSAAEATRSPLVVHLMTCDCDAAAIGGLRRSLARYPHATVCIHIVDPRRLDGLASKAHVTRDAFLRFLAPDVLPPHIARVVYLDSDLVVLDDLTSLFRVDLGGCPVGAVADCDWASAVADGRLAALGLRRGAPYLNSGVLVLDLARWREARIGAALLDYARRHGEGLVYVDQDALNVILQDRIAVLDRRWNVQAMMYGRAFRRLMPHDHAASLPALRNPGIVHYTTGEKPWRFRSRARRKDLYWRFRARTAWPEETPAAHLHQRLEQRLSRLLLPVGVDLARLLASASAIRGRQTRPA